MVKNKIPKALWGNSTSSWADDWKFRIGPSAKSKVLLEWSRTGKKPKPESSKDYTKRRVKEETKRTWRSDVADTLHGIGEGVLALHPYTAIPYYGAKVGQDFLNGTYGWHTALNASIPLFHLAPAPQVGAAIDDALETAAKKGSTTARELLIKRNLGPMKTPVAEKVPDKNLFRTVVYKGGEIEDPYSTFLTTDPKYASNYGKVAPYIFESNSIAKAREPMMGSSDPVTMDMFIYNNTKSNPKANAIIGHDKVTDEFPPSLGTEVYSMSPTNLFKINRPRIGRTFTGFKELQGLLDMLNNSRRAPYPPIKGERMPEMRWNPESGDFTAVPVSKLFDEHMVRIPKELIKDPNVEVTPFSDLHTVQDVSHFTPRVKAGIGKFNELYGEETINRLKELGYNTEDRIPIVERGFRNIRFPSSVIRENSKRPVYLGTFNNSKSRMGEYHLASDIAIVDPTLSKNIPSVMLHERNMHGTDKVLEGFAEAGQPKAKNMYQDFLDKLFVREVEGEHVSWKEPAPGIERVGDNSYVIDYGGGKKYPMAKGTNRWYEGRSTVNELKRKYLYDEWKKAGKPATLEEVRPQYLKRIEGLSEGELLSDLANETNGYGLAYVALRKNNPTFILDLKELLKHGAGYVAPIGGGYMLYNKVNSLKQGGMLEFLKKGSGIHIKKENRGKFTDYCGGKVTSECIAKGKRSPNAAIRKRATFAANARKWKHEKGGKAFVTRVNILDSNPDAYKYVKKKYKMRSAQLGTKMSFGLKVGNFLNSGAGQALINTGISLLQTNALNKKISAQADAAKALNEADWQLTMKEIIKKNQEDRNQAFQQWATDYQAGKTMDLPSLIVAQHRGYEQLNLELAEGKAGLKNKNALIQVEADALKADNWSGAISGVIQNGLGVLGDYLGNKGTSNTSSSQQSGGGWTMNYNSKYGSKNSSLTASNFWSNPSLSGGNQFKTNYSFNTPTLTPPKTNYSFLNK